VNIQKLLIVSLVFCGMSATKSLADNDPIIFEDTHVPTVKQTLSEQYLTSVQAYNLLLEDSDILFIDVRDSVEIGISGHPAQIDAIVPLKIQTSDFDETLDEFTLSDNANFLIEMQNVLTVENKTKNDMIILTCGSGMRSAKAADSLTRAGYKNVWHIPDGYAGDDKVGINSQNAWKLAGLPWSKSLVHGSEWRLIIKE